jgi:hypothetical protein
MLRASFIGARVCFLMLAASTLGAGMLAAPAAASTSTCASSAGKCFAVAVSPSAPPAGGTVSFAFTITNEASTQQIGSFKITAPAANFVITGANVPSGPGTASSTSSSALFLNLALAPSATTTGTLTAVLPCSGGSYTWGMEVKQSNDFSGPPGNDFALDPASAGNLSGSLSGSCSLAFMSNGQPAGTGVGANIAAGFNSQDGPVKVGLLDASGHLITSAAATGPVSVTVKIDSNPGGGSLSGTTTEAISGGVASFPSLSIDKTGIGYTLIATTTASGISTSKPSAIFTIFGSLQRCGAPPCSASLSSKTTIGTVTTSSVTSTELLGSTLGGTSYSCATYQSLLDPFGFDVFSSSGAAQPGAAFSATLDISKATTQSSGRTSVSAWQICYASTASFTTVAGTSGTAVIGGVTFNTGLLPDCSSIQGAPCVQTRKKGNGGDVVITFLAVGDPYGRP